MAQTTINTNDTTEDNEFLDSMTRGGVKPLKK